MLFEKYWVFGEVSIALAVNVTVSYLLAKIGNFSPFIFLSLFVFIFLFYQILFIILAGIDSYKAKQEYKKSQQINREIFSCHRSDFTTIQKIFAVFRSYIEICAGYSILFDAFFIVKGWIIAKNEPFFQTNGPHTGIIIFEYHEYFGKEYLYGFGLDLLIKHFKGRFPYRIYPCKTKEHFIEIIQDRDVKSLWIFGHGDHGGVRYNTTGKIIDYKELVDILSPNYKKDSIYQMHCNHGECCSLVQLLSENRGYANNSINRMFKIRTFVREILNSEYPLQ